MKTYLSLVLPALLWAGGTPVAAAPITFNTALPVAKGAFINREQIILRRFKSDSTALNRHMKVSGVVSVLGYGITSKLALFAALPFLEKSMTQSTGGSPITRSSTGAGDLKVFARYTVIQRDMPSKTVRLAAFGGLKAPTGQHSKTDSVGTLPRPLQPGSGSWDSFAGLVLTYQTLPFQADAQVSFRRNGRALGFQVGHEFRADLSLQYRLLPQRLSADTARFLYGVVETSLITQNHNKLAGVPDRTTGGTTVYLTPGLQYVTKKWILEAAIQLPIVQNLKGTALRTDYLFTTGFRVNF